MLEIEIKAKIDSLEDLEKKIINRGGCFRKEVIEEDIYFNHPRRDFAETDEALRLRRVEERVYLTYKGPKIDKLTKTREEINIKVSDYDRAAAILKALGFVEVMPIIKKRRYLRLKDYDIMLDHLEGLGSFMEVEKRGKCYNPHELVEFLKELGIHSSETRSYLELTLEKSGKNKS